MDWLKCNICFNTYNDTSLRPRTLSCGHTFCEKCINTAFQNKIITCPQCRKVHSLESALDIPINFTLEGLLKSLNQNSQETNEEAISSSIEGESDTDRKSEIYGSLNSLLDQQERSLSSQKELLKTSAGICYEHPSNECILRCSVHKSWVCEECIEEQGDHPKDICKIKSFKEEIEDRTQEHKRSLDNEGKFCDETLSVIEDHISFLRNEREQHISLINRLQDLVNMHKKEEENLQNEINSFENIIEEGKNVKKMLLDMEVTVLKAATLDESNTSRDLVKNKNSEARNWSKTSQREVDAGKVKLEGSTHLAVETKICLDNREKSRLSKSESKEEINETTGRTKEALKKTKLQEIDSARQVLNRITHLYEVEINEITSSKEIPWNMWEIVTKVQIILLELINMIYKDDNKVEDDNVGGVNVEDDDNEQDKSAGGRDDCINHETEIWAVEASNEECSVLAGRLYIYNGNLFMESLLPCDSLPLKAITLPVQHITAFMSFPRHLYLSFSDAEKDQPLGEDVIICLNEKSPSVAQEFIKEYIGLSESTYYGSNEILIKEKGWSNEYLHCKYLIKRNRNEKDFQYIKKRESIIPEKGLVFVCATGGFGILTRDCLSPVQIPGQAIGMVVSGISVIEKMINDKLVTRPRLGISKSKIEECGLVIESKLKARKYYVC